METPSKALLIQPIVCPQGQMWQVLIIACKVCPFLSAGIYRDAVRMWKEVKALAVALDLNIYELGEIETDEIVVL